MLVLICALIRRIVFCPLGHFFCNFSRIAPTDLMNGHKKTKPLIFLKGNEDEDEPGMDYCDIGRVAFDADGPCSGRPTGSART
jgi:hypothetical protein